VSVSNAFEGVTRTANERGVVFRERRAQLPGAQKSLSLLSNLRTAERAGRRGAFSRGLSGGLSGGRAREGEGALESLPGGRGRGSGVQFTP